MHEVCRQDGSLGHLPVILGACFSSCAAYLCLWISSQDEYMKKKFQDLLLAQEKNLMALPLTPAQVF